jgi:hypothetical protein
MIWNNIPLSSKIIKIIFISTLLSFSPVKFHPNKALIPFGCPTDYNWFRGTYTGTGESPKEGYYFYLVKISEIFNDFSGRLSVGEEEHVIFHRVGVPKTYSYELNIGDTVEVCGNEFVTTFGTGIDLGGYIRLIKEIRLQGKVTDIWDTAVYGDFGKPGKTWFMEWNKLLQGEAPNSVCESNVIVVYGKDPTYDYRGRADDSISIGDTVEAFGDYVEIGGQTAEIGYCSVQLISKDSYIQKTAPSILKRFEVSPYQFHVRYQDKEYQAVLIFDTTSPGPTAESCSTVAGCFNAIYARRNWAVFGADTTLIQDPDIYQHVALAAEIAYLQMGPWNYENLNHQADDFYEILKLKFGMDVCQMIGNTAAKLILSLSVGDVTLVSSAEQVAMDAVVRQFASALAQEAVKGIASPTKLVENTMRLQLKVSADELIKASEMIIPIVPGDSIDSESMYRFETAVQSAYSDGFCAMKAITMKNDKPIQTFFTNVAQSLMGGATIEEQILDILNTYQQIPTVKRLFEESTLKYQEFLIRNAYLMHDADAYRRLLIQEGISSLGLSGEVPTSSSNIASETLYQSVAPTQVLQAESPSSQVINGSIQQAESREYVYRINKSQSVRISVDYPGSRLDLHVYDSQGRHVGINYDTGNIDQLVPGSEYSGPESNPQWIRLPQVEPGQIQIIIYAMETNGKEEFTLKLVGNSSTALNNSHILLIFACFLIIGLDVLLLAIFFTGRKRKKREKVGDHSLESNRCYTHI